MKEWVGDLEANGFLEEATQVWCGAFKTVDGKESAFFDPFCIKEMLEFMDTCEVLIFHNGTGYDFPLLKKLYNYEYHGVKHDTMIMSKLYWPKRPVPFNCPVKNKPHSIETWGYRVGRGKPEHNEWHVYSEDMAHRNKEDTEITRLVYLELLKEKSEYNWDHATWLSERLFEIIGKQEAYGWKIDQPWAHKSLSMLEHWQRRIEKVLASRLPILRIIDEKPDKKTGNMSCVRAPFKKNGDYSEQTLRWYFDTSDSIIEGLNRMDDREVGNTFSRVTFRRLDPNKRVEAIDFLLSVGWIPTEWNYSKETGEPTSPKLSHKDKFEGITDKTGQLFAKLLQIKHRHSNILGYLKRVRSDGRIPSRVTGLAETGRAKHADVVNVPNHEAFFGKWMRRCFTCEDDKVLIGCDSAGCQNRMLAARVGNPDFTETLINGKKENGTAIHNLNQKAVHKAGYEHVSYGLAKGLNYAFMFGASDNKLGKMVGGSKDDGDKVRTAMLGVAPGFADVVESLQEEWRSNAKRRMNRWGKVEYYNGWIAGLDGRPIFIDSEHKLLVYMLQSDEAIMMSAAYVFLHDWLTDEGFVWGEDWAYVNWNHDEYTIECKPEHVERISFLAEQAIAEAGKYFNIACPHVGEAQVGRNWGDIH